MTTPHQSIWKERPAGSMRPTTRRVSGMMFWLMLINTFPMQQAWTGLQKSPPVDNKFVTHHIVTMQRMDTGDNNIKNCWICTHSPVTSASLPFLAIPVSPEEMFNWTNCADTLANNQARNSRLWNTTVGIPIVGWISLPWWQGNLSGNIRHLQYLAFRDNHWFPRTKTGFTELGNVPHEGIQISFRTTSIGMYAFKPDMIERHIHNTSWQYGDLFLQGTSTTCEEVPGNLPCNESSSYEPGVATCGNPDVGYCSPLGQIPSWCMLSNVSEYIDLVHRLVLQHSALWDLPKSMYWACGSHAYKWLPVGVRGTCTLVRLTPATYIVPYEKIDGRTIPKHMIYKRAADNKDRPSHRPHVVQMGKTNKIFSTLFIYPMMMQMWDKLVESTDYLDDQIWEILEILNTSIPVQNQLLVVTNQHTVVLDYLTAAQGGLCQIVGPTCCHYIDPQGALQLSMRLNDVYELRTKYEKDNSVNRDDWWDSAFSFLNPANWFKGISGWIMGIIQVLFQIILALLVIYVLIRVIIAIIRCARPTRRRRGVYMKY